MSNQNEAYKIYESAKRLYASGQYALAIGPYEEALKLGLSGREQENSWLDLADCYLQTNDSNEAEKYLKKLSSSQGQAVNLLKAVYYFQNGKERLAFGILLEIIKETNNDSSLKNIQKSVKDYTKKYPNNS